MDFNKVFQGYPRVDKIWGTEVILTNRDEYCSKIMLLKEGYQCSLHRHTRKTETFFILQGKIGVESCIPTDNYQVELLDIELGPGDPFHVWPGMWHRFWQIGSEPAVMLEVSSHHSDDDVERLEPSGPISK